MFRDQKLLQKNLFSFFKTILEDAVFNDEIHENMKSHSKMKYIHIGFKIVEQFLAGVNKLDNNALKIIMLKNLLLKYTNFRHMLVRNVQMTKNQLHEVAKLVKVQIIAMLESLNQTPTVESLTLCSELLNGIFGPNSFTHFSPKKNFDILFPICNQLDQEAITTYIETLQGVMDKPSLKEFYPVEFMARANAEEDKELKATLEATKG